MPFTRDPRFRRPWIYPVLAARRSWVLRGVIVGFSEEARTRGFASLILTRFAFRYTVERMVSGPVRCQFWQVPSDPYKRGLSPFLMSPFLILPLAFLWLFIEGLKGVAGRAARFGPD